MTSVFKSIIDWFKEAAEWITENLGDPIIAEALREDLGLATGASVSEAKINNIKQFASGLDPDQTAFFETIEEIKVLAEALIALGDDLTDGDQVGWDVVYILVQVASAESVRLRAPWLYGTAKILGLITENNSEVDRFLIDPIVDIFQGEGLPDNFFEAAAITAFENVGFLLAITEAIFGIDGVEVYAGWDPDPTTATPVADRASEDAVTLLIRQDLLTIDGAPGDGLDAVHALTLVPVGPTLGGPGLLWSFGTGLEFERTVGPTFVRIAIDANAGLSLLHPLTSDATIETELEGPGLPSAELSVVFGRDAEPAITLGDDNGTKLDIETAVVEMRAGAARTGIRFGIERATLVIDLNDGDSFLGTLPGGEIRIAFGLVFDIDSEHGLRIEGGLEARALLPVHTSLFGVFTIEHLELALGPSTNGYDAAIEVTGAFGLQLGPLQATVDRMGLLLDVAAGEGNLMILDADLGFRPPAALGLVIDAGIVKGGGFLSFEPDRGEYAGALELKIGPVNLAAIGVLTTQRPDGSDGWSLLFLLYTNFPAVQLGFGFTLTGVGGLIGLHHTMALDALQNGLRTGVLDDVLFPKNVVARAPAIINKLQSVFPISEGSLVIGPMIEVGWGTPQIVTIRAGIIVSLDNALSDGAVEFNSFAVVGQVAVKLGKFKKKELIKLLIDFLGYYDAERQRVGFIAQLRDSHVAGITLTGSFIIQADFGAQSSFILSAGGFHPKFQDLPDGLPAKIDRLGAKLNIGIVKITLEGYFAVTPATVQVGASVRAVAKIGPVSLDGWLGFDALFEFQPRFRFTVDLRAGVAIKFKSFKLASVELEMTFSGPGRWEASGKVTFSILWWDISKSFDVATGEAPSEPEISTAVAPLVQSALNDSANWSAQLPVGGEGWISFGDVIDPAGADAALLAHPLGTLSVLQNVVPFDLRLERFGETSVDGADRFTIDSVTIGGTELPAPTTLRQRFARSHFVEMSSTDRLTEPSFEEFPAGIEVGTDEYVVPDEQIGVTMDYETYILEPDRINLDYATLLFQPTVASTTNASSLAWQATLGAVAQSPRRTSAPVRGAPIDVRIDEPELVFVTNDGLEIAHAPGGAAMTSFAAARQEETVIDRNDLQLVEAFEVARG